MKKDFKPYKVGTVFNKIEISIKAEKPFLSEVVIEFPSRLNAMAIDPSKIASNQNLVYTPGEIVFSIGINKKVKATILSDKDGVLEISSQSKRKPLIKHAYLLMKDALGFEQGIRIDVDNTEEMKHCGLGSSSGLIAAVAVAINELYGNPINDKVLVRYLAQNHGEEIEGREDIINPVQCIGGSAASGIFNGGLIVLGGKSCVIKTMDIPEEYKVVIGIPKDFKEQDSKALMDKEIKNLHKFLASGKKFGPQIAYNIFHKFLPAMIDIDLKTIGDVIFDYRFRMGSIKNCSFVYKGLIKLSHNLSVIKNKNIAEVLSISSVGPAFFAITTNADACLKLFEHNGLKTFMAPINNGKYKIISKKTYGVK